MTTAGMFGTVVAVNGDRMTVEVAPGVQVELLAAALARVVPADLPEASESSLNEPAADELAPVDPVTRPSDQIDLTKGESEPAAGDGRTSLEKGEIDPRA